MITWWMKPTTRTRFPTLLVARDLLYAQRHGWTYQGLWLPKYGPLGGKWKLCSGTRQIRTNDLSVHSRPYWPPDHKARITWKFTCSRLSELCRIKMSTSSGIINLFLFSISGMPTYHGTMTTPHDAQKEKVPTFLRTTLKGTEIFHKIIHRYKI